MSSYDLACPAWGTTPDEEWLAQEQNLENLGEFV
jgi:hypothetical protein